MSKVKILMATAISLGFFSIFAPKALPDEIEFFASNQSPNSLHVRCDGPYLRTSKIVELSGNADPTVQGTNFYAAEINWLSPFGDWRCCFGSASSVAIGGQCSNPIDFCLEDLPGRPGVNLEVSQDGSLSVNYSRQCSRLSTSARLGDDPKLSKPDRDTKCLMATEGDEIVVTLVADGTTGQIGTDARLTLRDAIAGVSFEESSSGPLPLELHTTVPATGEYDVMVDQQNIPSDIWFRGGYLIHVESSAGDIEFCGHDEDVEHN